MAELQQHWQDFGKQMTLSASQAGEMYRSSLSIKMTLRLVADHLIRINSHGEQEPRFSKLEMEAMVSGAVALAERMEEELEDLHFDSFGAKAKVSS